MIFAATAVSTSHVAHHAPSVMPSSFFLYAGLLLLALIFIVFIRVVIGPTVMDRLLAVNVIGTKSMVLLVIIGLVFNRVDMFVDIAIGYGLLNFIASIAAARYFHQQKRLSPEDQWKEDMEVR